MSTLVDVFGSLKAMSQWQLLLAFVACIGYVAAQGRMFGPRGRRIAWASAGVGAAGFALESAEWTFATMLLGFAVAGVGLFVALVWLTSRALGFAQARSATGDDAGFETASRAETLAAAGPRSRSGLSAEPAHSI